MDMLRYWLDIANVDPIEFYAVAVALLLIAARRMATS